MPQQQRQPGAMNDDPHHTVTDDQEMGSAGHETGLDEPSATGTAGLYATPVHEETEEAEDAGQRRAERAARQS